jgi:transcriptional regulator with XRE-family HTH domain
LLEQLSTEGLTQLQVALQARLPAQYLSDIQRGRRPMSELVARRIGEEFDVNFEWLLGTSDLVRTSKPASGPGHESSSLRLPLFPHPIEGEPREVSSWNGAFVETAGIVAAKAALAKQPYVLEFGNNDPEGRIRKGDLILISQVPKYDADLSVIRHRRKSFLVRPMHNGCWKRVATEDIFPPDTPVTGHVVAIIWSVCDGSKLVGFGSKLIASKADRFADRHSGRTKFRVGLVARSASWSSERRDSSWRNCK